MCIITIKRIRDVNGIEFPSRGQYSEFLTLSSEDGKFYFTDFSSVDSILIFEYLTDAKDYYLAHKEEILSSINRDDYDITTLGVSSIRLTKQLSLVGDC